MRACLSVEIGRVQTKATCPRQTDGRARGARFFPARSFLWFGMRAHAIGPLHERQKQHRQKKGWKPNIVLPSLPETCWRPRIAPDPFCLSFFFADRVGAVGIAPSTHSPSPNTKWARFLCAKKCARAYALALCFFFACSTRRRACGQSPPTTGTRPGAGRRQSARRRGAAAGRHRRAESRGR